MQSANWLEKGAFKPAFDAVAVNGYPVRAVTTALICQPPASLRCDPGLRERFTLPERKIVEHGGREKVAYVGRLRTAIERVVLGNHNSRRNGVPRALLNV